MRAAVLRERPTHVSRPPADSDREPHGSADGLPSSLVSDLRTDHAGETGAVLIYRGILAVTRDAAVRRFALRHLATERRHLMAIEALLAPSQRSGLLPLWRIAGWLTGALPSLIGARAVYATITTVETFVDQHYGEQIESIERLDPGRLDPSLQALRAFLASCRADEICHRDEAIKRFGGGGERPSPLLRLWLRAVDRGSRAAVKVCRWV